MKRTAAAIGSALPLLILVVMLVAALVASTAVTSGEETNPPSAAPSCGCQKAEEEAASARGAGEEHVCPFAANDGNDAHDHHHDHDHHHAHDHHHDHDHHHAHDHHHDHDHDAHSSCPFANHDHGTEDEDGHHHHDDPSSGSDKINNDNYREWVGEYTNSKGERVEIPLLFTLPGTRLNLLTQRNFMEFVGGGHLTLPKVETRSTDASASSSTSGSRNKHNREEDDRVRLEATSDGDTSTTMSSSSSSSPAASVPEKTDVSTLTIIFWYKKHCGGLCEDAYAQYRSLVKQWTETLPSQVNQSLLLDHKLVVQFGQYEVVDHEERKGQHHGNDHTPSYRFGPGASHVFDFPTVTLTLATPELLPNNAAAAGGSAANDATGSREHHVKRVQVPTGYRGRLCPNDLLHQNIHPALKEARKHISAAAAARKKQEGAGVGMSQDRPRETLQASASSTATNNGTTPVQAETEVELSENILKAFPAALKKGDADPCASTCAAIDYEAGAQSSSDKQGGGSDGREGEGDAPPQGQHECAVFEDGVLELL